jgi:hypothetical protein
LLIDCIWLTTGRFGQYGDLCWRKRINWQRPNWPLSKYSKRKSQTTWKSSVKTNSNWLKR